MPQALKIAKNAGVKISFDGGADRYSSNTRYLAENADICIVAKDFAEKYTGEKLIIMESERLYQVQKEDLPKLENLLTQCFREDPLYHSLIPNKDVRERLMPELFTCDLTEFFETCEIYADSSELNSILVVSDGTEHEAALHNLMVDFFALLKTDGYLIKEDPSLATLRKFIQGKDYLNSSWTSQLHTAERLHVIYLAVAPKMQHHGLAEKLMDEVIDYADRHKLMISLETHNPANVSMYEKFGFKLYGIVQKKGFDLKQYCMIKQA